MSTYRAWYLSLAAFVLVAGPLSAQAEAAGPMKLVYAVWKDSTGAASTIRDLDKGAKDQIESYAILTKDKAGKIQVKEKHDKAGGAATTLQASETLDTAIARLGEPVTDSASGYAPAPRTRRLSEEDLKKITGMLQPGESALILLSAAPATPQIKRSLGMGGQGSAEIVELEVKE